MRRGPPCRPAPSISARWSPGRSRAQSRSRSRTPAAGRSASGSSGSRRRAPTRPTSGSRRAAPAPRRRRLRPARAAPSASSSSRRGSEPGPACSASGSTRRPAVSMRPSPARSTTPAQPAASEHPRAPAAEAGSASIEVMAEPQQLRVGGETYSIYRLDALQATWDVARLPYTLRILLENVLRNGTEAEVDAVAGWVAADEPSREISFSPARVLLQDFTGVPCVVDLAAMRQAMHDQSGDPNRINPHIPVELVIDHSVQVDEFASRLAIARNVELEFERNRERYAFLRWGQTAFDNFKVVPPNTGICHQVNLEHLARVVETRDGAAFPDTLVGTDSHTTMVNGLGVLGWGVGGIEAEAAMLGEALSMLVPQVVGFRLSGELPQGATATDLVLTVTEMLRKVGVVGKLVEYFGPG